MTTYGYGPFAGFKVGRKQTRANFPVSLRISLWIDASTTRPSGTPSARLVNWLLRGAGELDERLAQELCLIPRISGLHAAKDSLLSLSVAPAFGGSPGRKEYVKRASFGDRTVSQ